MFNKLNLFPRLFNTPKRPFRIFAAAILIVSAFSGAARAQDSLSLADLLIGLRSKKVTIEERNRLLTEAVKVRGITFVLTPEIEKELETTGADTNLIASVREKSSAFIKISKPEVKPEPKPEPPPIHAIYKKQGDEHFGKGEWDLAIAFYNEVIEMNGADSSVYHNRGVSQVAKRALDKAIADFDKAAELDPKNASVFAARGNVYEKVGNLDRAAEDYEKALTLNAENELAKAGLTRVVEARAKAVAAAQPKTEEAKPAEPVAEAKPEDEPAADPSKPVNLGILNKLATRLVMPRYPAQERSMNIHGLVTVQVELDETGKIVSVEALSGPKTLRVYAEDAVRKSKFGAPTFNGIPVRAVGYINYNFVNTGNEE